MRDRTTLDAYGERPLYSSRRSGIGLARLERPVGMLSRPAVVPPTNTVLAIVYFLLGLTVVANLAVEVPPFQNPDEPTHFLRAEQLSRFVPIGRRLGPRAAGGEADPGILRAFLPFGSIPFNGDHKVTRAMYADAATVGWGGGTVLTEFSNTAVYPPFLYAPSVVTIWAGKLFHIPVVQTLYLARAATGVTGVATGAAAVALAGAAAPWLFVLLSLPMSLAQMASPSQDGLMIPLAALVAALLFSGLGRAGPISSRRFLAVCLCLALIGMARPPNAALVLLLLLPCGPPLRLRLAGAAAVVAAVAAWTGLAGVTAAVAFRADVTPEHFPDPAAQLAGVLADPAAFVAALGETLRLWSRELIGQVIGRLGWLDVPLPHWLHILAYAALAVGALLSARAGATLPRRLLVAVASGTAILAAVFGMFLIQYLMWTPVGAPSIEGVQGRYFLPPLMFAVGLAVIELPLAGNYGRLLRAGLTVALVLFPIVAFAATLRAIVGRYYF